MGVDRSVDAVPKRITPPMVSRLGLFLKLSVRTLSKTLLRSEPILLAS